MKDQVIKLKVGGKEEWKRSESLIEQAKRKSQTEDREALDVHVTAESLDALTDNTDATGGDLE